ncbi:MAG: 2-polyprenylphenol 6-hydroxylase [Pseudomonadota bacterium]
MFSAIGHILRLGRAGWTLARHDALVPREYAHLAPVAAAGLAAVLRLGGKTRDGGRALRPGERLAAALSTLGPAYIKLGQFLATRPDMVGFQLAQDLAALQDRLPPFAQDVADQAVAAETGAPVSDTFLEFGPAVAAASIAQVHKAALKDGRAVAVKVLRPGVEAACARDVQAFFFAARLAERASKEARRLEAVAFVETLADSIRTELDLRMEAAAASELAEGLQDDKDVRTPAPVWEVSGRRVFVMDWIEGTSIGDIDALDRQGVDRAVLADTVMRVFLRQAMGSGFFHADMHQGNLFVDGQGRLALVDFGIMGRLDEDAQRYLAEILWGFLRRDYARVARVHFEAGYVPARHSVDKFAQALRAVGEPIFGQGAADISMSRLMLQLFEVTALFDMHLRPELVLLQKTMVTVEGVARTLDPAHNMWEASAPVVEAWMQKRVGPEAHLKIARDSALEAGRLLQHLPETLRAADRLSRFVGEDGVKLDPASLEALSSKPQPVGWGKIIAGMLAGGALAAMLMKVLSD